MSHRKLKRKATKMKKHELNQIKGKQTKLELCASIITFSSPWLPVAELRLTRALYKRELLPHLSKSGTAAATRTHAASKCVINDPASFELS